jgi:hypothetical protein
MRAIAEGISPDEFADKTFAAICSGNLYCLRNESAATLAMERVRNISESCRPTMPRV